MSRSTGSAPKLEAAEITGDSAVAVETGNVTRVHPRSWSLARRLPSEPPRKSPRITIDGKKLAVVRACNPDRSWAVTFRKEGRAWGGIEERDEAYRHPPAKSTAHQVRLTMPSWIASSSSPPTGTPLAPGVAAWVACKETEARHHGSGAATSRGDAQVREDEAGDRCRNRRQQPGPMGRPRQQRHPGPHRR